MSRLFQAPNQQLLRAEFSDVEEMCATVKTWDLDFRPLQSVVPSGMVGEIIQSRSGPLEFTHARFGGSLEQRGAPPVGLITFVVLETNVRQHWWNTHDLDADAVMVSPVGSDFCSYSGPDFEVHTISASEETVRCICERFQLAFPSERSRPALFRPPADLLNRLRRSLRLTRDQGTMDAVVQTSAAFEELVLVWVRESGSARTESVRPARARDRAIRLCLEHIEQSHWTEVSASFLCGIAGVGERTLQLAFRERFGLTPAAFLKARRLGLVRQQLLRCDPADVSIGQISAALGFMHVGQFAADYRRAFGETPSETLERVRRV